MVRESIARLLPGVFQTALHPIAAGIVEPDRRLSATLGAMETLHEPVETVLHDLDRLISTLSTLPSLLIDTVKSRLP